MMDSREGSRQLQIALTVNGEARSVLAYPMDRLLDVLREQLQLTGTKEGCGEGECGSCSILMDGILVNSCLVPVMQARGSNLLTIEGISMGERLHRLQASFLECGGAQCGICTPGMILAAFHLLSQKSEPTMTDIREGLSGNLCRCTGYSQIVEAVADAVNSRTTT
jgi:carbon-monoxide dehydrogenase small subunit